MCVVSLSVVSAFNFFFFFFQAEDGIRDLIVTGVQTCALPIFYASQTSGWFGQIIQRSDDGGKTWIQPGTPPGESTTGPGGAPKAESNKFVYEDRKSVV